MVVNRNYSALEDELANAERIVFKRLDGTEFVAKTAMVSTNLSIGAVSKRDADFIHDVIFDKDIISRVRLSNILGVGFLNDLSYNVDSNDDVKKCVTIMNNGQVVGTAEKYHYKGVRKKLKHDRKARYNELVKEISKEYTFRIPDGRVVIGTDLNDYEFAYRNKMRDLGDAAYFAERKECYHDFTSYLTIAFIMERDGSVSVGLIDTLSGTHLATIWDSQGLLSEENQDILHKRKEEYLRELENTERTIIRTLNSKGE